MGLFHRHHMRLPGIGRLVAAGLLAAGVMLTAPTPILAQSGVPQLYTVNGGPVSLEVQQLMMALGLTPGHYYVDQYGNLGMQGQPPLVNLDGGPPRSSGPLLGQPGTVTPAQPAPAQPAPAPAAPPPAGTPFAAGDTHLEQQLVGIRMYWMFESRLGHGGSSGYFHLCPNNVFHRSAEGSFRIGGDYNAFREDYDPYVAGASHLSQTGNWRVEQTSEGAVVRLFPADGGDVIEFQMSNIQSGRWYRGDFRYFSEVGQASCG